VNNLILFIDILERDLTLEFPPYRARRLARYAVTMDVASGEGAQARPVRIQFLPVDGASWFQRGGVVSQRRPSTAMR
jgi:hypothetical protein